MKQLFFFICMIAQFNLFAQPGSIKYTIDSASVKHAGVPEEN